MCFFYWYLFQLSVPLNPDFNCCSNFVLSWVDKLITGAYSLVPLIANIVDWFALVLDKTQFIDQIRMRLISQLINDISTVLQKLLKYFGGTFILTIVVPRFSVLSIVFSLTSNKALLSGQLPTTLAVVKSG